MGFEPTISAGERPQTYALDRAATGTGILFLMPQYYSYYVFETAESYNSFKESLELRHYGVQDV